MRPSIVRVFEACAREVGVDFFVRMKRAKCPVHRSEKYTLSIDEEKETWHCFVAHCAANKGGGFFDIPIVFGLAADRSEASRWLAKKGLIAPARRGKDEAVFKPHVRRMRGDRDRLSEQQLDTWRQAQLDLIDELGERGWFRVRDFTGEVRQQIWDRRQVMLRELERLTLESNLCVADGGNEVQCIDRFRAYRQRPDLYSDPKWADLRRTVKLGVPEPDPFDVSICPWAEADWDKLVTGRSIEIDRHLALHPEAA